MKYSITINSELKETDSLREYNQLSKVNEMLIALHSFPAKKVCRMFNYKSYSSFTAAMRGAGYPISDTNVFKFDNKDVPVAIARHMKGEKLGIIAKEINVSPTWLSTVMRCEFNYSPKDHSYVKLAPKTKPVTSARHRRMTACEGVYRALLYSSKPLHCPSL